MGGKRVSQTWESQFTPTILSKDPYSIKSTPTRLVVFVKVCGPIKDDSLAHIMALNVVKESIFIPKLSDILPQPLALLSKAGGYPLCEYIESVVKGGQLLLESNCKFIGLLGISTDVRWLILKRQGLRIKSCNQVELTSLPIACQ